MGERGPGPQPARSVRWEECSAWGLSLTAWMCCSSPGDSGLARGGPSPRLPAAHVARVIINGDDSPCSKGAIRTNKIVMPIHRPVRFFKQNPCKFAKADAIS